MRIHPRHGLLALSVSVAVTVAFSAGSEPRAGASFGTGTLVNVSVMGSGDYVVIALVGDRVLSGSLQEIAVPPYRVFVDLASVVPDVNPVTPVGRGGVERVRVALNRSNPPVTRVVLDLSRQSGYRVERDPDRHEFRIVIGPDPSANVDDVASDEVALDTPRGRADLAGSSESAGIADYAVWFARVAQQVESLLVDRPRALLGEESDPIPVDGLDWQTMGREVELVTAPLALREAHDLLVTVVNLGEAGTDRNVPGTSDEGEAAAHAGARMLLVRARALVDARGDPASVLNQR